MPWNYMFVPLPRHFDSGFGATAEAFKTAAEKLSDPEPSKAFLDHLPAYFLFRHSIELFLKSCIIILHRRLRLPYGAASHTGTPSILVGEQWKPIYTVHGIATLYSYFRTVFDSQFAELSRIAPNVNWLLPEDLDKWIDIVHRNDPTSTMFRYPETQDAAADKEKSGFQESTVSDIFTKMEPGAPYVKAFLVLDSQENVKEAYILDEALGQEVGVALRNAANALYGLHAAMRFTLTNGW